jgi:FkbH-like protein
LTLDTGPVRLYAATLVMTRAAELPAILARDPAAFWSALKNASADATSFEDLFYLSRIRERAVRQGAQGRHEPKTRIRLALASGYTTYPLHALLTHLLDVEGIACDLFAGEFDNYTSELLEPGSALYQHAPNVIVLFPSERRCRYEGKLTDPVAGQRAQAAARASEILGMCRDAQGRTGADVILGNFIPPARFDPGPYRARTLASDWSFRRAVNLELGLNAPRGVHICDLEYLAARRGLLAARDERAWFESKQLGSPDMLVDVAREVAHIVLSLRRSQKKVLVLDLDNTLWGGVIGDDGLNGIEVGDTSPRGEAFKAFQHYALSLTQRGVLLAVCSKNDEAVAREVFERHPEMVLRMQHFSSFKANWNPKSENIQAIANELSLGLDSFVFVDDNPAEIEIVRQFCPAVTAILLGPDPAGYAGTLQDARLFEPMQITEEDLIRVEQYRIDHDRRALQAICTDMDSYLRSLEMTAQVAPLDEASRPRVAQLINKSNQFNLTTIRRSEAELAELARSPRHACFSVRLADRFGDHGLISVLLAAVENESLVIDTWIMSCRVLKRQVEDLVLNEVVRIARETRCGRVVGTYVPTAKNGMVREHYPSLGFHVLDETPDRRTFVLSLDRLDERPHHIRVQRGPS